MVWPFTSSSSEDANRDPLKDLDPSLRTFLERESPVKYAPPQPPSASTPSRTTSAPTTTPTDQPPSPAPTTPASTAQLPPNAPTLYKDGRYAHLWATYQPLAEIENANTSPQDKLADVLAGYRDRKASIGKAALENCAVEQSGLSDCYRNGAIKDRLTNCRSYMKKLDRCYTMNQRLLRALGYLSAFDRPAAVEEQIQMHADKLYQTMVAQEEIDFQHRQGGSSSSSDALPPAEVERVQAAAEARMRAEYDPGVDPGVRQIVEELRPKVREKYAEKLQKLSPHERPLEERALAMELITGKDVVRSVSTLQEQKEDQKEQRAKTGQATMDDRLSRFFGW